MPNARISRAELSEVNDKVRLYLSLNRYDAAEKILRATLADKGSMANLINLLGVTYHRQGRFTDAIQQFREAIVANPQYLEAALNLTVTLCDLSRYDEARETYSRMLDGLQPGRRKPDLVLGRIANHHVECGNLYEENGMAADAIQEYRKALALFGRLPDVRLALAKLYYKTGQREQAQKELEQLIEEYPDLSQGHMWLGITYFKLGKSDKARKHWEKAQLSNPSDLASRAYLKLSSTWQAY